MMLIMIFMMKIKMITTRMGLTMMKRMTINDDKGKDEADDANDDDDDDKNEDVEENQNNQDNQNN